ncbi:hypothetical protein GJ496_005935 [Pomphorhynchus laevis]|nr:hypothetical protein GJ496_005935 [Pomphorhynchus laevis]
MDSTTTNAAEICIPIDATLIYLCAFQTNNNHDNKSVKQNILLYFFSTTIKDENNIENEFGLCAAFINFIRSRDTKDDCRAVITCRTCTVFQEVEPDIWFVMKVSNKKPLKDAIKLKSAIPFISNYAESLLQMTVKVFSLLYGTITFYLNSDNKALLSQIFDSFFHTYVDKYIIPRLKLLDFTVLTGCLQRKHSISTSFDINVEHILNDIKAVLPKCKAFVTIFHREVSIRTLKYSFQNGFDIALMEILNDKTMIQLRDKIFELTEVSDINCGHNLTKFGLALNQCFYPLGDRHLNQHLFVYSLDRNNLIIAISILMPTCGFAFMDDHHSTIAKALNIEEEIISTQILHHLNLQKMLSYTHNDDVTADPRDYAVLYVSRKSLSYHLHVNMTNFPDIRVAVLFKFASVFCEQEPALEIQDKIFNVKDIGFFAVRCSEASELCVFYSVKEFDCDPFVHMRNVGRQLFVFAYRFEHHTTEKLKSPASLDLSSIPFGLQHVLKKVRKESVDYT